MKEKRQNKLARALRLAKSLRTLRDQVQPHPEDASILSAAANMLESLVSELKPRP